MFILTHPTKRGLTIEGNKKVHTGWRVNPIRAQVKSKGSVQLRGGKWSHKQQSRRKVRLREKKKNK
jgi:hypothetical protein